MKLHLSCITKKKDGIDIMDAVLNLYGQVSEFTYMYYKVWHGLVVHLLAFVLYSTFSTDDRCLLHLDNEGPKGNHSVNQLGTRPTFSHILSFKIIAQRPWTI